MYLKFYQVKQGFNIQIKSGANYMVPTEFLKNIPKTRTRPLKYIFQVLKLKPDGLWLEFGVYRGDTINYISKFTDQEVYGFDSFQGLPEAWKKSHKKGHFNLDGKMPEVNTNVKLIKGWFNETLENFLLEHKEQVGFIHIDCDIYSSCKYVLDTLKDRIGSGTIIVFDELIGYIGYNSGNGELRAWHEFITENKVNYKWICTDSIRVALEIV